MTTKQNQPQEATTLPLVRPKHPYSQVLKWIADGEVIQGLLPLSGWIDLDSDNLLDRCAMSNIHNNNYFQPNEFRIKPKPHTHQELMDAHKAGASIQFRNYVTGLWKDVSCNEPLWDTLIEYRIKPHPKPDIIGYCNVDLCQPALAYVSFGECSTKLISTDNVKVTFCGETLKLKAVEIIRGDSNGTI